MLGLEPVHFYRLTNKNNDMLRVHARSTKEFKHGTSAVHTQGEHGFSSEHYRRNLSRTEVLTLKNSKPWMLHWMKTIQYLCNSTSCETGSAISHSGVWENGLSLKATFCWSGSGCHMRSINYNSVYLFAFNNSAAAVSIVSGSHEHLKTHFVPFYACFKNPPILFSPSCLYDTVNHSNMRQTCFQCMYATSL